MLVQDLIADILKREGVETLFCYPTNSIIEACAAVGIRPVLSRQERVGVDMAHGYARVTNGEKTSVFAMQYGPGAENAFPGIATVYSDSTPVLLLPLGHPRERAQMWPMFKSSRTYASVTKQVEELIQPEQTASVMRRALGQLRNGRPGPVMVEIPEDLLTIDLDATFTRYRPVRSARVGVDVAAVDEAARMLIEARNPILQAGQGVLYAGASPELLALAEFLQVPVVTTIDGKSAFPEDHALSLGAAGLVSTGHARNFLRQADLIFAVGSSMTPHPLVNPRIPAGVRIVQATTDARDLYKGFDIDLPILGDAKLLLAALLEAVKDRLGGKRRQNDVAQRLAAERDAWMERWRAKLTSAEKPMTPYRVMAEFIDLIDPAEAIVTHDSGSPRDQLTPFYRATVPNSYIGWGKSHQLGTGLGLSIGAKIAKPDKFCVAFMGDAAFGMTGLDFETAVRCSVPTLTIVLNNSTMAVEKEQMALSHERYRTRDLGGNYAALARDLGGWGERVEEPGEIRAAILRARRATEDGRTALLEFITSEERAFSNRLGAEH